MPSQAHHILNHAGDQPLAVELNRRHRQCTAADTLLLNPSAAVITDADERHLATLGRQGALDSTVELLERLHPDAALVMPSELAGTLQDETDFNAARWSALETFQVQRQPALVEGRDVEVLVVDPGPVQGYRCDVEEGLPVGGGAQVDPGERSEDLGPPIEVEIDLHPGDGQQIGAGTGFVTGQGGHECIVPSSPPGSRLRTERAETWRGAAISCRLRPLAMS